jgi:hypothetical protein
LNLLSRRDRPVKRQFNYDREAYKRRNLIERCVNRLKQFRRIATRYEKTARAFVSMLCIAAARLRIKTVNTAWSAPRKSAKRPPERLHDRILALPAALVTRFSFAVAKA